MASESFGDPVWNELFRTHHWFSTPDPIIHNLVQLSVAHLRKEQAAPLAGLDIGAGFGACSIAMAMEGIDWITALEGAPTALPKISEAFESYHMPAERLKIICGDITRPKDFLAGEMFDLMVDGYSLYANDPEKILSAMGDYRLMLKPHAVFIAANFGWSTSENVLKERGQSTFFSRQEQDELFKKAGFKIIGVERIWEELRDRKVEKHLSLLMRA